MRVYLPIIVVLVATITLLPTILRAGYGILVVDQSLEGCNFAVVVNAEVECFDEAARLLSEGSVDELLIVGLKPRRAVAIGAVPSDQQLAAMEFDARGIPRERYRFVDTDAVTYHDMFRRLDADLIDRNGRCAVIGVSTRSRYFRTVIDQALPSDRAGTYCVRSVYIKPNEADNWYRERGGVRRVMIHGLNLMFVVIQGESEVDPGDPYEHVINRSKAS